MKNNRIFSFSFSMLLYIDDPHHDNINIKYRNNNNNINIDESYSAYITAHTSTNNRYSETLSFRQNKDNSKLGKRDSPTIMIPRGQRFTTILSCRGVLICMPNGHKPTSSVTNLC